MSSSTNIWENRLELTLFILTIPLFLYLYLLNFTFLFIFTSGILIVNYLFLDNNFVQETFILSNEDERYLYNLLRDSFISLDTLLLQENNLPIDSIYSNGVIYNKYTSITNIGMYLLSLIAVHKLEIITDTTFVIKLEKTIDNILALPRNENTFYNWYDLKENIPAFEEDLSSVDLGNFHISLICLYEYIKNTDFINNSLKKDVLDITQSISYTRFCTPFEELSSTITNYGEQKCNYYNIWASETRIASFLAIATGAMTDRHWYSLEKEQSNDGMIISWGGRSFE